MYIRADVAHARPDTVHPFENFRYARPDFVHPFRDLVQPAFDVVA
jgi:hypothetical protein